MQNKETPTAVIDTMRMPKSRGWEQRKALNPHYDLLFVDAGSPSAQLKYFLMVLCIFSSFKNQADTLNCAHGQEVVPPLSTAVWLLEHFPRS